MGKKQSIYYSMNRKSRSLPIAIALCSPLLFGPKPNRELETTSLTEVRENSRIEMRIQQELRKHSRWILTCVQTDYSGKRLPGQVQMITISDEKRQQMRKLGAPETNASFNHRTQTLQINDSQNPETTAESIDAIDHELFHVIYDRLYRDHSSMKEFSGPSHEELTDFCNNKVQSPEFTTLVSSIHDIKERSALKAQFQKMGRYVSDTLLEISNDVGKITDALKMYNQGRLLQEPVQIPFEDMNHDWNLLKNRIIAFNRLTDLIIEAIRTMKNLQNMTASDISQKKSIFSEFAKSLEQYQDLPGITRELANRPQRLVNEENSRKLVLQIEGIDSELLRVQQLLKQEQNKEEQQRLLALQEELQESKRILIELNTPLEQFSEIEDMNLGRQNSRLRDNLAKSNEETIEKILGNPNEVMARVIDSLCSLYFGSVNISKFPLNEDDLQFLEKFKFRGDLIFKDNIAKYRLAKRMIEDGLSPDHVKKSLEYVSDIHYKDKVYNFSLSPVVITGRIPEEE
jgi:hypothetical protein